MGLSEIESLRFEYEYGGKSVEDLCKEYSYMIKDFTRMIELEGWQQQSIPDIDNLADINNYYSLVRRQLTIEIAKRAIVVWPKLKHIEDRLIQSTLKILKETEIEAAPVTADITSQTIVRLVKVLQTLYSLNQTYSEAVLVPSITDRNLKELLKDKDPQDVEALLKILENRSIPVPDIPLEDVN